MSALLMVEVAGQDLRCGYDRNDQGFLVPNGDQAAVRAAFAFYRQGDKSFRRVALELNEAGYTR